jgi:hypothetical protein
MAKNRIGRDKLGTYRRGFQFGDYKYTIAMVLLVAIISVWGIASWHERYTHCNDVMHGTYMTGYSYARPTCVRDGKIVTIYKYFGRKVVNP